MNTTLTRTLTLAAVLAALALVSNNVAAQSEKDKPKDNKVDVTIVDLQFRPESVTVKAGQTVRWTNKDNRDHILMAKDQSFKSENLKPGEKFEHTFKEAGTFEYLCVYRPRMTGTVVVEAKE